MFFVSFWRRWRAAVCVAALCALTILFRLGGYGLIDADEGRYASIPLEMLRRGDWVTPTLNGARFFDKPVLLYWCEMVGFLTLGASEFAARLVPATFALAGIAAVYAFNRRSFGTRAGVLGAAILGTTLLWAVLGRVVLTDTPLASLSMLALCFWWLGRTEHNNARRQRLWWALFWASLGLSVLAKGPVGVLLAFGAIVPFVLWCRPREGWRMGASWGVFVMLAVAAPWFVWVAGRNAGFNHLFWWEQNFGRFLGSAGVPDHWEKPWYFLPLLPLIFFPWSVFLPRALGKVAPILRRARGAASDERVGAAVFLVFAALFVLGFFSVSKSKLVTYIAPLVPPVCALLGAYFDASWRGNRFKIEAGVLSALGLFGGAAAWVFARRAPGLLHLESAGIWLGIVGMALFGWAVALVIAGFFRGTRGVFAATAGGFALFVAVGVSFWCALAPTLTTAPLMARIRPAFTPDTRLASVGFIQSLGFYSGRRVAVDGVVGGRDNSPRSKIPDELLPAWKDMSAGERAQFFYGDAAGLRRLMAQSVPVFVFARNSRRKKGVGLFVGGRVLASNARYSVFGNAAATKRFDSLTKAAGG